MSINSNQKDPLEMISDFEKSFLSAYRQTDSVVLKNMANLLIGGMGGSGISGNYISEIINYYNKISPFVLVVNDYEWPRKDFSSWCLVIISYSGNTAETLNLVKNIQTKITTPIKTIFLSSGGKLKEIAELENYHHLSIKPGYPPRYAFPLIFGSLLKCLSLAYNIPLLSEEEMNQIENSEVENKKLEEIANKLTNSFPIILSSKILYPIALRFRCQINENSKKHAASFSIPEFNHNGIVGFDGMDNTNITIILIEDELDNDNIKVQIKFLKSLFRNKEITNFTLKSSQNNFIGKYISLTKKVDMITYLMAKLQDIDPIEVPSITALKYSFKDQN